MLGGPSPVETSMRRRLTPKTHTHHVAPVYSRPPPLRAHQHISRGILVLRRSADPGIIPRSVAALLRMVTAEKAAGTFNQHRLTMSYLELYNEKIFDLLEPKDKDLYIFLCIAMHSPAMQRWSRFGFGFSWTGVLCPDLDIVGWSFTVLAIRRHAMHQADSCESAWRNHHPQPGRGRGYRR